ncbi:hypothetical protein A2118_00975 [Candidatus Kaiserbacteria bacterium GWA2_50_9]|uniref:Uncharacterized protein n=1 Tax=Candidatus Kaiserbacteria bacterium GWA2_50_9 TaxID=1798474 RepID=A0A1F6BVT9_9BACT|nr:MAG: hypothetical protein A2118_00975 [Candidatus Kaiserbacteria bacterium GWA2_50_9]
MKKTSRFAALLASFAIPLLAAAQTGINTTGILRYSTGIGGVINNILVPVLMAIAFIVFLWGVYKYFILGAADEKSRTDGRQFTLWGIIGFVVIFSLWAFVNLLRGTFGLDNNATAPPPPTIWGTSSGVNPNNQSATQYSPFGGSGGGIQPTAQQQAALTQQYNATQGICSQNSTSADCQAAQAAYSASYYSVNSNPNATIQNAEITTVGAGADCTYNSCAAGLTCGTSLGYPTCEASGGGSDWFGTDEFGTSGGGSDWFGTDEFGTSNIDPSDPSDTGGATTYDGWF